MFSCTSARISTRAAPAARTIRATRSVRRPIPHTTPRTGHQRCRRRTVRPPEVIPIDLGRQLFVDDFLIEETVARPHVPPRQYYADNPVLWPTTPWEKYDEYAERTKTRSEPGRDGVQRRRLLRSATTASSRCGTWAAIRRTPATRRRTDGIVWDKPGARRRPRHQHRHHVGHRDSSTVWLDQDERDPARRYKMARWYDHYMELLASADGIHWRDMGRTGLTGDRTTFFYNPFRKVWVFSLRDGDRRRSVATGVTGKRRTSSRTSMAAEGRAGPLGGRRRRRSATARVQRAGRALQPRLRRLRERAARPVHDLPRRAARIARSPTTSASASAATGFTLRGPIAMRSWACPNTSATGTGPTSNRPAAAVSSSATSCISTSADAAESPAPATPASAARVSRRCGATASRRWITAATNDGARAVSRQARQAD